MAVIDYKTRRISAKLVYWGAQGSGKTTSVRYVWERTRGADGQLAAGEHDPSIATFDYLPLSLGEIRGFSTHFELYTVPGARGYESERRELLDAVDGVVFVADGRRGSFTEDVRSLAELESSLRSHDRALDALPWVIQVNKRDLADAVPTAELLVTLGRYRPPCIESVATTGQGVFDALKAIAKLVLIELRK
jgi:signal recognition particle receptor subunit beta